MHHDLLLIGVPLAAFTFLFFHFCRSESQSLPLDTAVCFQFLTDSFKKNATKSPQINDVVILTRTTLFL